MRMMLSNRASWMIADVACVRRGHVVVPMAWTEPDETLRHIANECGLAVVFASPEMVPRFAALGVESLRVIVELPCVEDERPAAPVEDARAPSIHRLIADMIETMEDAPGTGLAATQVHVPLRLVIFKVESARARREDGPEPEAARDGAVPLTVLINPEIEPLSEDKALGWEACLSVPGLAGEVPRHTAVRYRGLTLDGDLIEREATGFHARVVQHECDHLDGMLYPRRMADLSRLAFTTELKHLAEED